MGKGDNGGKGGGNGGSKGNGRHHRQPNLQQQQQQQQGKKRNGAYIVCSSDTCGGYAYLSQMGRDEVECKICGSLYFREWFSEDQKKHWDEIAK